MTVLLASFADANSNRATSQCLTKHLKNMGMLDSSSSNQELSSFCQEFIEVTQNTIYNEIGEQLRDKTGQTNDKECIINKLRAVRYGDYIIREMEYESYKSKSSNEMKKKITDNFNIHKNLSVRAVVRCAGDIQFNHLFNALYVEDPEEKEDLVIDYCTKNYVVKKNLVDPIYKINVNKKNIDVTDIDCSPIESGIKLGAENIISDLIASDEFPAVKCATQKYHAHNFVDESIVVTILRELNLNDVQLAVFRNKYIDMMTTINVDYLKCL